jgi:hypothetical protein
MVTLVMAAAFYLQVDFARRPDLRVAALLGLVLAAGVLTKENTKPGGRSSASTTRTFRSTTRMPCAS